MKSGDKVKLGLRIPKWIRQNKAFSKSFLRGLFDTDGCVFRKYGKYAQIQFKFAPLSITESLRELLISLDFTPTIIQKDINKYATSWKIYLARQTEVDRFFAEIRPGNKKHLLRYKKIRSGVAGI